MNPLKCCQLVAGRGVCQRQSPEESITAGLRFALSKWQAILIRALFAGLVGYIIRSVALS